MTPPAATATDESIELTYLPLAKLEPHPDNVRKRLGDLTELTKSIEGGTGILEPLLVLPAMKGKHRVVAGHRRLAAASKAKDVTTAPCVIRAMTDAQVVEAMLVENLQRAEISAIEEARGYARLVELDSKVADIARKVGRSQPHVKGRLALLELPDTVLAMVEADRITLGAATEMIPFAGDDEAIADWCKTAATKGDDWDAARARRDPAIWIRNRIAEREHKAALAKLTDRVALEGWRTWAPPAGGYFDNRHHLGYLTKPAPLEQMKLKIIEHRNERCHAVFIDQGRAGGSKPTTVPICTDPKRHTAKAKAADRSDIQMPAAAYRSATASDRGNAGKKQVPAPKLRKAIKANRLNAAHLALETLVTVDDALLHVVLVALDARAGEARQGAAEILGLVPEGDDSLYDAWSEFWPKPENLHDAVAAVALAICRHQDWDATVHGTFVSWLVEEAGYQPLDGEEEWLGADLDKYMATDLATSRLGRPDTEAPAELLDPVLEQLEVDLAVADDLQPSDQGPEGATR